MLLLHVGNILFIQNVQPELSVILGTNNVLLYMPIWITEAGLADKCISRKCAQEEFYFRKVRNESSKIENERTKEKLRSTFIRRRRSRSSTLYDPPTCELVISLKSRLSRDKMRLTLQK